MTSKRSHFVLFRWAIDVDGEVLSHEGSCDLRVCWQTGRRDVVWKLVASAYIPRLHASLRHSSGALGSEVNARRPWAELGSNTDSWVQSGLSPPPPSFFPSFLTLTGRKRSAGFQDKKKKKKEGGQKHKYPKMFRQYKKSNSTFFFFNYLINSLAKKKAPQGRAKK